MLSEAEIATINDRLARLTKNSTPSSSSSRQSGSIVSSGASVEPIPRISAPIPLRRSRGRSRGQHIIPRTIRTRSIAATEQTDRSAFSSLYLI